MGTWQGFQCLVSISFFIPLSQSIGQIESKVWKSTRLLPPLCNAYRMVFLDSTRLSDSQDYWRPHTTSPIWKDIGPEAHTPARQFQIFLAVEIFVAVYSTDLSGARRQDPFPPWLLEDQLPLWMTQQLSRTGSSWPTDYFSGKNDHWHPSPLGRQQYLRQKFR